MNQTRTMRMRGDFVLLRADALRLLLPQREVATTVYLEQQPATTREPGIFTLSDAQGTRYPVIALSEHMRALDRFPSDRFVLTRLGGADQGVCLAWNEVRVLIDTELEFHALPDVMQGEGDLIDAYVELDGELAFCTSTRRALPVISDRWTEA